MASLNSTNTSEHVSGVTCSLQELTSLALAMSRRTLHLRRKKYSNHSGGASSSVRGRGMEYFESRPYVNTDEIRNIDWKVSARLNKTYTKLFVEEKERPIYLVIDFRPSMFFGSQNCLKSVLACKLAAMLGYAATNGNDKLNAFIIESERILEIKVGASKKSLAKLFGVLSDSSLKLKDHCHHLVTQHNNFERIFERIIHTSHPGSTVFLLSDFFSLDLSHKAILFRLRKKSDVFALKISDPLESYLPNVGQLGLTFGNENILVNAADAGLQKSLQKKLALQKETIETLFSSLNIPIINFSTSDDPIEGINSMLQGVW